MTAFQIVDILLNSQISSCCKCMFSCCFITQQQCNQLVATETSAYRYSSDSKDFWTVQDARMPEGKSLQHKSPQHSIITVHYHVSQWAFYFQQSACIQYQACASCTRVIPWNDSLTMIESPAFIITFYQQFHENTPNWNIKLQDLRLQTLQHRPGSRYCASSWHCNRRHCLFWHCVNSPSKHRHRRHALIITSWLWPTCRSPTSQTIVDEWRLNLTFSLQWPSTNLDTLHNTDHLVWIS